MVMLQEIFKVQVSNGLMMLLASSDCHRAIMALAPEGAPTATKSAQEPARKYVRPDKDRFVSLQYFAI